MTMKPVIMAVDDEPTALAAIERDVQREYGADFRIVSATSGSEALETLKQLKLRNEAVALLLIDQRMPHMTGVEFLEQAMEPVPGCQARPADGPCRWRCSDSPPCARRSPTTTCDKPWDAPEEQLYPILKDLLADWQLTYRPPSEGLRVIGHRWAANTYRVRDLLARNQVRYQWLDLDTLGGGTPPAGGSWVGDATPAGAALPRWLLAGRSHTHRGG